MQKRAKKQEKERKDLFIIYFWYVEMFKAWIKMEPDWYHCCKVVKRQFCAFCRIKQAHTKTSTPTLSKS